MARRCIGDLARAGMIGLLLLATTGLAGCQIGWFLLGSGHTKAAYKLPKKTRVLVMVDRGAGSGMPLNAPQQLGRAIDKILYAHDIRSDLVPQFRLTSLRRAVPGFRRWSIARVARKVHAAVVVYVYVPKFLVHLASNGQVTLGYAQATVKVVDDRGRRLWPTGPTQSPPVVATIPSGLKSEQSPREVQQALVTELAISVGRFFHSYKRGHKPLLR